MKNDEIAQPAEAAQSNIEDQADGIVIYAPMSGEAIEMKDVEDDTFAAEVLGKGGAIRPSEGKVYAPFDGEIALVFDTKHAIALTGPAGVELLIHIGINTVELGGTHYKIYVNDQDQVKKGDLLAEFDMEAIAAAGYKLTTPIIVNNTDDYSDVELVARGTVRSGDPLIRLK